MVDLAIQLRNELVYQLQQGLRERVLAPTDTTIHYREPALDFTSK